MVWDITQLEQLLSNNDNYAVSQEDGCLCVTNSDGVEAYVAVSGQQIIVESLLFAKEQVADASALNEEILKTHQVFPLTTVGLTTIDGDDYYMAFGALSAQSKEESIVIEVDTLFQNVEGFLEAYQDHLTH